MPQKMTLTSQGSSFSDVVVLCKNKCYFIEVICSCLALCKIRSLENCHTKEENGLLKHHNNEKEMNKMQHEIKYLKGSVFFDAIHGL